jgi:hypothetical protein
MCGCVSNSICTWKPNVRLNACEVRSHRMEIYCGMACTLKVAADKPTSSFQLWPRQSKGGGDFAGCTRATKLPSFSPLLDVCTCR